MDMREKIVAQQQEHQDQFDIATAAALQRGFGRWFDDTWNSAKANGALPNPFISSMFVFIVTVLLKKFIGGLHPNMPVEHKEMAIADAKRMMIGYLDQIEAAAIKDVYAPKEPQPRCPKCFGPLPCAEHPATTEGKQTIILPKKRVIQ